MDRFILQFKGAGYFHLAGHSKGRHKKTVFFYFRSKGWGVSANPKIFIFKNWYFFDHFSLKRGGVGGWAEPKNPCQKKTEVSKKGEGGGSQFLGLKVKKKTVCFLTPPLMGRILSD